MPQLYDHCIVCGKEKTTYQQRMNSLCAACSRQRQKDNAREGYAFCVDCGEPKTTYSQQLSSHCNACSGKQKRVDKGEYYTHCIDCGAEKPLGTSRRSPRCRQCAYDELRKNEFFDVCQGCGKHKAMTRNRRCRTCANKVRRKASEGSKERVSSKAAETYPFCQECGREKANTDRPRCKACVQKQIMQESGRAFRVLYDTCQSCGKKKTKNDRELCLRCAGIKRMTEMFPDTDREYPYGWSDNFKEAIRERDGRKCAVCGRTEKANGRKMDVHHIDYDKTNLHPSNLVSLCLSCHPRTNWDRPFWLQVFTKYRGRQPKQDWQRRVVVSSLKGEFAVAA